MLGYLVNKNTIVVQSRLFVPRETSFLFVPRGTILEGFSKLVCEGFYNLEKFEPEHNLFYQKIEKVKERYNNYFHPNGNITIYRNFSELSEKLVTYHELAHQFFYTEEKCDITAINQIICEGYFPEQIFWELQKLRANDLQRLRFLKNYLQNLWQWQNKEKF